MRIEARWIALLVFGCALALRAQDEELAKRRDQKLAEPWLKKAAWITDYDKAREQAKKSGKVIFAYFTRSYAP